MARFKVEECPGLRERPRTGRLGGMSSPLQRHWMLDPEVTFLNHGSFGAAPRAVLVAQQALRDELERQPVHFFVRTFEERLDAARIALAAFVGADPEGLGFVPNATTGVNAVLRSLTFAAGDELVVSDHEYNACRNVLEYVAARSGARVVVVEIPFPSAGPDEVVEAIEGALTDRTRLLLVDHVTSATGLILPLERIVPLCRERGVEVLVDGAHAPGMIPVDLDALGASWYTANCHKWICAPKGAAFLWAREDVRADVRPAVMSHGANLPVDRRSRFRNEFDWQGTQDPTPWLAVPVALEVMAGLVDDGWPEVMRRNRALALEARRLLCEALGAEPPCPDSMIGSLATIPLPDGEAGTPSSLYVDPLQRHLWDDWKIEVPISPWPSPPRRVLRISAQLYNDRADYQRLADALLAARPTA